MSDLTQTESKTFDFFQLRKEMEVCDWNTIRKAIFDLRQSILLHKIVYEGAAGFNTFFDIAEKVGVNREICNAIKNYARSVYAHRCPDKSYRSLKMCQMYAEIIKILEQFDENDPYYLNVDPSDKRFPCQIRLLNENPPTRTILHDVLAGVHGTVLQEQLEEAMRLDKISCKDSYG